MKNHLKAMSTHSLQMGGQDAHPRPSAAVAAIVSALSLILLAAMITM